MLCYLITLILSLNPMPSSTTPVKGPAKKLVFREEMRFGGTGEAELTWRDGVIPAFFDVSPTGRFVVGVPREMRLLMFDSKGQFLIEMSHQGEGLGQYRFFNGFQILQDGRAIGADSSKGPLKLNFYDSKLIFSKDETLSNLGKVMVSSVFSPDGKQAYALALLPKNGKMMFEKVLVDEKFKTRKILMSGVWPMPNPDKLNDSEYWSEYLAEQFKAILQQNSKHVAFLSDGTIVIANAQTYQLDYYKGDLEKPFRSVLREGKPELISAEAKEDLAAGIRHMVLAQGGEAFASVVTDEIISRAIEKANLPKLQNRIHGLIPMEKGGLAVVTKASPGKGNLSFETWDANGRTVAVCHLPDQGVYNLVQTRLIFKNGFMYAMIRDEEGENTIVKFSYQMQ